MGTSTGGLFTSVTVMVKLLVSLRFGEPSSVTRTLMTFVLGPCASVGAQVKTPVTGLMAAPAGGEIRLNVSVLAGRSGSLAVAVSVKVLPSLTIWLAMAPSTGGLFTSLAVTKKLLVSLKLGEPLSLTRKVIVVVPEAWFGLGVQVKIPVDGSIAAPAGGLTKLKVRVLVGRSVSVAVLVMISVTPSLMVWL